MKRIDELMNLLRKRILRETAGFFFARMKGGYFRRFACEVLRFLI
jgi:hypothetical protein